MSNNSDDKFLDNDQILDFLLQGNDQKLMLLFENTPKLKSFSSAISKYLNENKTILSDSKKYRIRNNLVQVDNNVVFLGLKDHKDLLLNNYSENDLRYYKDEERRD
jgi:hypothetical protein